MPGPLEGVRVADFTEIIAGPLAGRILAEQGADVIKIEPPWGEPWRLTQRFTAPDSKPESRTFMTYNRGKRSLPLDLTKPEAQEVLSRLVSHIDVVLVNYRPDVAIKLGVDYEKLAAINPRLVYCELTAYGRRGPDSHRPGYDMIIQAMTGMIASETKTVDDVPSWVWSSPLIDTASGIAMAGSVSAALFARERTGMGQKIETTLLGQALNLMGARFLHVEKLDREMREKTLQDIGEQREAGASYDDLVALSPGSRRREHHGNIYYRVYMAADGPIGVGCLSQPLRLRLLETLDLTDESMAPDWDPTKPESREYSRDLERRAEELFRGKTSGEWAAPSSRSATSPPGRCASSRKCSTIRRWSPTAWWTNSSIRRKARSGWWAPTPVSAARRRPMRRLRRRWASTPSRYWAGWATPPRMWSGCGGTGRSASLLPYPLVLGNLVLGKRRQREALANRTLLEVDPPSAHPYDFVISQGVAQMERADIPYLNVAELGDLIRGRELSPTEVTEAYLSRVDALNHDIRAYLTVTADLARQAAQDAEAEISGGHYRGPLHGVPVAVKDQMYTQGVRTTIGSPVFDDFVPEYDATVVARLKEAGAVLLGKLTMTEFATTALSHQFDPPRNPVGPRTFLRWLQQRQRGRHRSVHGGGHAGRGHRRVGALSRGMVRSGGHTSDVGPGQPLRSCPRRALHGHRRPPCPHRRGLRHRAAGHRRSRCQRPPDQAGIAPGLPHRPDG